MKIIRAVRFTNKLAEIFDFWNKNNESTAYSKKLNSLIKRNELIVLQFPNIGKPTSNKKYRIIFVDRFKIFYKVSKDIIYIADIYDIKQKKH